MMYEDQNLLKVWLNPKPIALKQDSFLCDAFRDED